MLSKAMGEKADNRKSIVWDWVGVYAPGTRWGSESPKPVWTGRPVVKVAAEFEQAIQKVVR
jgi:hypothetical protein